MPRSLSPLGGVRASARRSSCLAPWGSLPSPRLASSHSPLSRLVNSLSPSFRTPPPGARTPRLGRHKAFYFPCWPVPALSAFPRGTGAPSPKASPRPPLDSLQKPMCWRAQGCSSSAGGVPPERGRIPRALLPTLGSARRGGSGSWAGPWPALAHRRPAPSPGLLPTRRAPACAEQRLPRLGLAKAPEAAEPPRVRGWRFRGLPDRSVPWNG